jgi:putative FmdB family regulatory protein
MPTYEYECQTCGHPFEVRQSMKDPHLTECPQPDCPGPVKRKISLGSGFIFKGSGFYITDYRSDSYKAAAKKDSEGSSTPAAPPPASTPAAAPPPASSPSKPATSAA